VRSRDAEPLQLGDRLLVDDHVIGRLAALGYHRRLRVGNACAVWLPPKPLRDAFPRV